MKNRIKRGVVVFAFSLLFSPFSTSAQDGTMSDAMAAPAFSTRELIDFRTPDAVRWAIVNDGVMGGRSSSTLEPGESGTASFHGFVSLENNGGFASVRALFDGMDLTGFHGLQLRVRGDGRSYQLRLRTDANLDGVAYQAEFTTEAGEWQEVFVPFSDFQPSFRGWVPRGAPALDLSAIRQMGFLIGDKKQGPFELEIAWVRAISRAQ